MVIVIYKFQNNSFNNNLYLNIAIPYQFIFYSTIHNF